jgi:hypothetical protein
VVKFSDSVVERATKDKPLFIKLTDSLHVFAPSPSSLSNIKSAAYIGVISKKQPDQPEQAVQVLLLPEELRGLNEGSFLLPADKDATPVVEYKLSGRKPSPGDKIFVLVKRGDHDDLTGYKIVFF